jgi:hypothetical protein
MLTAGESSQGSSSVTVSSHGAERYLNIISFELLGSNDVQNSTRGPMSGCEGPLACLTR